MALHSGALRRARRLRSIHAPGLADQGPFAGLGRLSLFRGLPDRAIDEIGGLCSQVTVRAGQRVIHEGEWPREAFVILSGQVVVSSGESILNILGEGDVLGELALLDGGRRTASATAVMETVLLVFAPHEFRSLLLEPRVEQRVLEVAESRRRAG